MDKYNRKTYFMCAVGERWWRDENQNPVEDAAQLTFATKQQQRRHCCDVEGSHYNNAEVKKGDLSSSG